MSNFRFAKNNSKALKEESKKMKEKLNQLRSLMGTDQEQKQLNTKVNKTTSKWNAGSNINAKTGFATNIKPSLKVKNKEFSFNTQNESFRPISKDSESRTSTSTPFGGLRNNLNSTDYEGKGFEGLSTEIIEFLDSLKLSKYCQLFSQNGIEDIDTLLELGDDHFSDLGIPLGHKLKIQKKIKQVRNERQSNNEPEEEEKVVSSDVYHDSVPSQEEAPDYVALPYKEPSPKKTSPAQATTTWSAGIGDDFIADLGSGEYDEERMRQEFRAALSNWRGEDIIDERAEYECPNEDEGCGVVASVQAGAPHKPKSQMVTTTTQHRGGNVHEEINYGPLHSQKIRAKEIKIPKKVSCYNWYKLGEEDEFYYDSLMTKSYFCNDKWAELYHAKYCLTWPVDKRKFMKTDGILALMNWYCSEQWADKDTAAIEAQADRENEEYTI